ncbi:hypothetical protein BDR07DRAFT_1484269 [Suillus spraguei]|nr:hypothetical protein BDR07DRAFT_1484269 [Suillus spraguei]
MLVENGVLTVSVAFLATPFQISNPGSTPILHSEPHIPMSTPPPVTTTPITPTQCLSHTSDLSPNQLPFEMLDLGTQVVGVVGHGPSLMQCPPAGKIVIQGVQTSLIALHMQVNIRWPIFSTPLSNGVTDIMMHDYPDPATRMTDASARDSLLIQSRATSPPTPNPILTSSPMVTQIHTAIPVKFLPLPATSSPMVPQIPTSVPAKPLPLPATIEDWLNQLVAQRFLKLSQNVLAPALRHAVDALVPSIVEQLTDGLSDGLRASIHPRPPTRKTDILSDTQSSDDEDGLKPHLRRKHPGKRGLKNHLHVHFFISELTQAYLSLGSHSAPIYERKGS